MRTDRLLPGDVRAGSPPTAQDIAFAREMLALFAATIPEAPEGWLDDILFAPDTQARTFWLSIVVLLAKDAITAHIAQTFAPGVRARESHHSAPTPAS